VGRNRVHVPRPPPPVPSAWAASRLDRFAAAADRLARPKLEVVQEVAPARRQYRLGQGSGDGNRRSARTRQTFETAGQIHGVARGGDLHEGLPADLIDHDGAAVDAYPDPERPPFRDGSGQCPRCGQGPHWVVGPNVRETKHRHRAVAHQPGHDAAFGVYCGPHGAVKGAQQLGRCGRPDPMRKVGEPGDVDEQDCRLLAPTAKSGRACAAT
jgi:hypothetical protein